MTKRIDILDGWRGISILLVLCGHLLPLGPAKYQLNVSIAGTGMALFFILSGFLITSILQKDLNIKSFFIKRFLRILPLAWVVLLITLIYFNAESWKYSPHFFFYANWPPMSLLPSTGHFWSLCVEMQFYVMIGLLVWIFKRYAFYLLPVFCIAVSIARFTYDKPMVINTYFRIDEILAGCLLAMLVNADKPLWLRVQGVVSKLNPLIMLPILVLSAHPESGALNYFRPYIALLTIGSTVFNSNAQTLFFHMLRSRFLAYIAQISYALYLIHGVLADTWIGQGETKSQKYLKRPLLFGLTFLLAHISTFYYEKRWIALGQRLTSKVKG